MHSVPVYLVALFVILTSHAFGQVETFGIMDINRNKTCFTRNNEVGICVKKSMCDNAHEIQIGGRIIKSEIRRRKRAANPYVPGGGCNLNNYEWCCTFNNIISSTTATATENVSRPVVTMTIPPETTTATPRQDQTCRASDRNDCPWLVKLYQARQNYPYCLGAVIGSNTILTTATCAPNKFLWAQVPSSEKPDANYPILSRHPHPNYNSGSRLNDIALLITETNIDWGSDGPKGACIDPELSLGGECVAANIDEYYDLDMVSLLVTEGSCNSRGNVSDAMCGEDISQVLEAGAPIMCQKNNLYVLSGLTKLSLSGSTQALLGKLDYAWLTDNLKTKAGLKETDYSFVSSTPPTFGQVESTTKFSIPPFRTGNITCITRYSEEGICVHKSMCNNAHEIQIGGRIIKSELRRRRRAAYPNVPDGGCNLDRKEWCCSFKNIISSTTATARENVSGPDVTTTLQPQTTVATPLQEQNCRASDQNDCPWFVKLYQNDDSPYCLGAVIGSNTILTTATCARSKFLWAQVPSSENPDAKYTILSRHPHPNYNSGNRLNDIALLITARNITWGSDGPKGACIDPELSLGGECLAANIDEYYDIDMVSLHVTQGSCSRSGNVSDAMCGKKISQALINGAPIMCQKNNLYVLSGLTKTSLSGGTQALLGKLDYAWLTDNLKTKAGLKESDYLFELNYK